MSRLESWASAELPFYLSFSALTNNLRRRYLSPNFIKAFGDHGIPFGIRSNDFFIKNKCEGKRQLDVKIAEE